MLSCFRQLFNKKYIVTTVQVTRARINSAHYTFLQVRLVHSSFEIEVSNSAMGSFNFMDYDCIGFDLDNTVCRYKIGNMVKMEYESLANFLVQERGYSGRHLLKPIEENVDFMLKGLILDIANGNILRLNSDGHIVHGSHGTRELTRNELKEYYGEECRWQVTDIFTKDPLHTWNGPLSERIRTLLDYFDMPASLIFARIIDTLDEENGGKVQKQYSVWLDIVAALKDMFQKEHFQLEKGGYFPNIKADPENYIYKCSEDLLNWLRALKNQNKILFLITGSNVDFASHTAENSLGPEWKSFFDIIIFFAKKPGFFIENRSFIGLNGYEEADPVEVANLQVGGCYTYGNWKGLYKFFKKQTHKEEPKIVYVGDNLIQDVYTPSVHTNCDAVAICEELQAEGAFGHDSGHDDTNYLTSSTWGSYFHHEEHKVQTFWSDFMKKHARICIPSLEFVAKHPVDYKYPQH